MVRTRTHPITDRSSPRSTRTVTGITAAWHLSKSGIQNPDSSAEQPGQQNLKLLEKQPQKKKWMITQNKEVMMSYFKADPSQRGYRKQMQKQQHLAIKKSRLQNLRTETSDQSNVIMRRNLLTNVEIEEIQRGLSTQVCHTESSTPKQPMSNQPDLTAIEKFLNNNTV